MPTLYRVLADSITTTKKQIVFAGTEIPETWLPAGNIASMVQQGFIEKVVTEKVKTPAPTADPK